MRKEKGSLSDSFVYGRHLRSQCGPKSVKFRSTREGWPRLVLFRPIWTETRGLHVRYRESVKFSRRNFRKYVVPGCCTSIVPDFCRIIITEDTAFHEITNPSSTVGTFFCFLINKRGKIPTLLNQIFFNSLIGICVSINYHLDPKVKSNPTDWTIKSEMKCQVKE